jgi:uncharacterized protein with HEPN domain
MSQTKRDIAEELREIIVAVDDFSQAIKNRMIDKFIEDYRGWDANYSHVHIINEAIADLNDIPIAASFNAIPRTKELTIDVAARAMMLHYRCKKHGAL